MLQNYQDPIQTHRVIELPSLPMNRSIVNMLLHFAEFLQFRPLNNGPLPSN